MRIWSSRPAGLGLRVRRCAILFSGQEGARYRRVPESIESLPDFCLTDQEWDDLHLPINLVFFLRSTAADRVLALYPSPAGATESLLPLESWDTMVANNPVLGELEPDVEALLVHRLGPTREYFAHRSTNATSSSA